MTNNTAGVWVRCDAGPYPKNVVIRKIGETRAVTYNVVAELQPDMFEWLDESKPTFTLEDMKHAFNSGYGLALTQGWHGCTEDDDIKDYMKQQLNIDL